MKRFDLREIAPQPWKNGGGLTREIAFGGASRGDFDWRISVAEVTRDAPFSAFPGIDRCILLLRGAGMRLRSADGAIDHLLTAPLVPFRFAGDVALAATLVGDPSSDFNVMTRRGAWRSEVSILRDAGPLPAADVTLVICLEGHWTVADEPLRPQQGLLLPLPPGEGGGEGARSASVSSRDAATRFARAHPNPLPEGEGAGDSRGVLLVVRLHQEPLQ